MFAVLRHILIKALVPLKSTLDLPMLIIPSNTANAALNLGKHASGDVPDNQIEYN